MIQRADTPETQADHWFVIWAESRAEMKVEKRIAALVLSDFEGGMPLSLVARLPCEL
jgi:hypothetical protein